VLVNAVVLDLFEFWAEAVGKPKQTPLSQRIWRKPHTPNGEEGGSADAEIADEIR
jgi:hypothetical protein